MATVETEMTIKLSSDEMLALEKLLTFHYYNQNDAGLEDCDKDMVNGILFEIQAQPQPFKQS